MAAQVQSTAVLDQTFQLSNGIDATKREWYQAARRYIQRYQAYVEVYEQEPTMVNYYNTWVGYGGPEEGGWYYECGEPVRTHCVFSKKQAIREAIDYYFQALSDHEDEEKDSYGWRNFSVEYDTEYAKPYPTERPYYC